MDGWVNVHGKLAGKMQIYILGISSNGNYWGVPKELLFFWDGFGGLHSHGSTPFSLDACLFHGKSDLEMDDDKRGYPDFWETSIYIYEFVTIGNSISNLEAPFFVNNVRLACQNSKKSTKLPINQIFT